MQDAPQRLAADTLPATVATRDAQHECVFTERGTLNADRLPRARERERDARDTIIFSDISSDGLSSGF